MNSRRRRGLQNDKIRQLRYDKICAEKKACFSKWQNFDQLDMERGHSCPHASSDANGRLGFLYIEST